MKHIGGQAVIEGVMMKSDSKVAVSVRKKGKIITERMRYKPISKKFKILTIPIVRGFVNLIEMMVLGMKALTWSANQQADKKEEQISKKELGLTFFIATVATVLIFIVAPYYIAKLFIKQTNFLFNLVDGVFRIIIFFLYLIIIGRMADMKEIFRYHGAEHKSVNCYEAGVPLTPKNAKKYPKEHIRCGTSLLVIVIVVSILLFSLIKDPRWYVNIPIRILLIPLIAGVGYEAVKIAYRFKNNILTRIIIAPGIWTQKLTTKEPSLKQLEVAIKALNAVK
ncbi:DUF1385 domain-containing protein [Candidatus Woesearchaeota archaeon]|nr:DUF1385 domain-containing protein [Candidatus Woesearchaeota archaeon]MBW3006293.1 DUF1385 domain-containing protein [Candidatus Woesearchaeota archaeon]